MEEVTGMKRELHEAQEEYDSLRVQLAKSNEEAGNLQSVVLPPVPDLNADALTDFARRVLRGEVSLIYHERQ